MFNVGDIVEIIPTEDDDVSQRIAGSTAQIARKETVTIGSQELYTISFIDLKDSRHRRATAHWQPKNLCLKSTLKETDINESDIINLLSGE